MKRRSTFIVSMMLVFCLSACGMNRSGNIPAADSKLAAEREAASVSGAVPKKEHIEESDVSETETAENPANTKTDAGASHILIAYFSAPEDVNTSGVDAIAGASIVVKAEEVMGNTEYVAKIIQQTVGGDLFQIETVQQYPLDHDTLVNYAADEQDTDARPELATHIENLDQYDVIILGFPNWWADMPQPLYTFMEEYDFGGKTIIPFVTHGGSGFSDTRNTIKTLQPDAQVSDNTLSLPRGSVADSERDIISWAESLGLEE